MVVYYLTQELRSIASSIYGAWQELLAVSLIASQIELVAMTSFARERNRDQAEYETRTERR